VRVSVEDAQQVWQVTAGICGEVTVLSPLGNVFVGKVPIRCRGNLDVSVFYTDGHLTSCHADNLDPYLLRPEYLIIEGRSCHWS
jgi:hypothetical protein